MDLLSKDKTEQQMNIINEKLKEMKDKKEFEQKLKIDNLLLKVQFLDERKKRQKIENERLLKFKEEQTALKHQEINYNRKKLEKILLYQKQKTLDKLRERSIKAFEYKKQHHEYLDDKKNKADDLYLRKKQLNDRLEEILSNPQLVSEEELRQYFPKDEELIENILKYQGKDLNRSFDRSLQLSNNNRSNMDNSFSSKYLNNSFS